MNLKFWKTKPKLVPKVITVTGNHMFRLAELIDNFGVDSTVKRKLLIWDYVSAIYPETKDGYWQLDTNYRTCIKIISAPKYLPEEV